MQTNNKKGQSTQGVETHSETTFFEVEKSSL
jgi:hypothetical protein